MNENRNQGNQDNKGSQGNQGSRKADRHQGGEGSCESEQGLGNDSSYVDGVPHLADDARVPVGAKRYRFDLSYVIVAELFQRDGSWPDAQHYGDHAFGRGASVDRLAQLDSDVVELSAGSTCVCMYYCPSIGPVSRRAA